MKLFERGDAVTQSAALAQCSLVRPHCCCVLGWRAFPFPLPFPFSHCPFLPLPLHSEDEGDAGSEDESHDGDDDAAQVGAPNSDGSVERPVCTRSYRGVPDLHSREHGRAIS